MKSESVVRTGEKVRWIWFDLDDTLIDFRHNSASALRRLYLEEGLSRWFPTPEIWTEAYERVNRPLWQRYSAGEITMERLRIDRFLIPLSGAGMDPSEALDRSRSYDTYYLDLLAEEKKVIEGAHSVLQTLRSRGYRIGILSNGFSEVQYRKMDSAGLTDLVDLVVLSDEVGIAKPHPGLFEAAMQRSGMSGPEYHVMVGDNPSTDIAGALACGWGAVYFSPEPPAQIPPGVIPATALADVLPLFPGISPAPLCGA